MTLLKSLPLAVCFAAGLTGAALAAASDKLPPCAPDGAIPPGGCMAPKDPPTPLENLKPAPPLTVPSPGAASPGAQAPSAATPGSPSVVKPPPTGDAMAKPTPPTDPKMPVLKPPPEVQPKS